MKSLLLTPVPILIVGCSFGDPDIHYHEYSIYRGTVRDVAAGTTLSTFCAGWNFSHADRIVFAAPPGSRVELEVLIETPREWYKQGVAPDRDEAFWCDPGREVSPGLLSYWRCLHEVGTDPPAVVIQAQPRGQIGFDDISSGYALQLDVKHAGVLMVDVDKQCPAKPGTFSDATAPEPRAEATIQ